MNRQSVSLSAAAKRTANASVAPPRTVQFTWLTLYCVDVEDARNEKSNALGILPVVIVNYQDKNVYLTKQIDVFWSPRGTFIHLRELQDKVSAYEERSALLGNENRQKEDETARIRNGGRPSTSSVRPRRNVAGTNELHVSTTSSDTVDVTDEHNLSGQQLNSQDDIDNPLTASPSQFAVDPRGEPRYLGHSSTWSFSYQVRNLFKSQLGDLRLHDEQPDMEGAAYGMSSILEYGRDKKTETKVPSRDYVEYLANAVDFHLGSTYHLFDKRSFTLRLDNYYEALIKVDERSRKLEHIQILLVIAFGRLILGRQATEFGPPGAEYFVDAMELLPRATALHRQPILAIEVLCFISLYLQCVDMRNAAFNYIGQALRIALSQGLNRNMDSKSVDPDQYSHRIKLWWTVCILDRKLSTLMGAPIALDDETDIKTPHLDTFNVSNQQADQMLALNVTLSRLLGRIMRNIYRLNERLDKTFLESIQEVLATMTKVFGNLNQKAPLRGSNSSEAISRAAATLHLAYYQCAILTIRPILFHLIQKRLASNGIERSKEISSPVQALLKTCVEAANASLKILSLLYKQDLIELFLPFDSEATFSSAFVLIMATIADSNNAIDLTSLDTANSILHNMAFQGNMAAISYEVELDELSFMAKTLRKTSGHSNPNFGPEIQSSLDTNVLCGRPENILAQTEPALETDIGAMQTAVDLLDAEFFDNQSFGMLDDQWFWAPDGQSFLVNGE